MTVLEAGSRDLTAAFPDETLRVAVDRMLPRRVGRLPMVNRDGPRHSVGYLGRTGMMEARQQQLTDEGLREQGWQLPRRTGAP